MGRFLALIKLLVVMGLCSVCYAGGNPEDALLRPLTGGKSRVSAQEPASFTGPADWVYEASDWVLNLYIIGKGADSKVSHGVLLFEGKAVEGTRGEIRALPIGTVQYNGPAHAGSDLRDDSGWQMRDPLVKPKVNTPSTPSD